MYYTARQLLDVRGQPTGLWHFTAESGRRVFPVGYCATDCPGHANPYEADEHYRWWLLDHAVFHGRMPEEQRRCEVCGEWSQRFAYVPGYYRNWHLCEGHCDKAGLSRVLRPAVGRLVLPAAGAAPE